MRQTITMNKFGDNVINGTTLVLDNIKGAFWQMVKGDSSADRNPHLLPVKDASKISPAEIPAYIKKSVAELQLLAQKISEAKSAGDAASRAAEEAGGKTASFAWYEDADKEREVISALQASGIAQANAVATFSEAQKIMFEYLSDVAKILRGLFVLGCKSIAANRAVVHGIEECLNGGSLERLDELAQHELESLMIELNEQRDILDRQQALGATQEEHDTRISKNADGISENKGSIERLSKADREQRDLIKKNFEEDRRRDELIRSNIEADRKQDKLIQQNFEEDQRRDELIKQNFEADKKRDELIKKNSEAIAQNIEALKRLEKLIVRNEEECERRNEENKKAFSLCENRDNLIIKANADNCTSNGEMIKELDAKIATLSKNKNKLAVVLGVISMLVSLTSLTIALLK